jgi:hypothetical protein
MRYWLFFAVLSAGWMISVHTSLAEEVGASSDQATAAQTATTNEAQSTGESVTDVKPATPRVRDGGNIEWRRSDHSAANPGNGSSSSERSNHGSPGGEGDGGEGGGNTD